MLQNVYCDIFTVCETFLKGSQEPKIDGFTWIGNNRGNLHANAHRGSGGVGAFLKNELFDVCDITVRWSDGPMVDGPVVRRSDSPTNALN